jgi:hypothetical protein
MEECPRCHSNKFIRIVTFVDTLENINEKDYYDIDFKENIPNNIKIELYCANCGKLLKEDRILEFKEWYNFCINHIEPTNKLPIEINLDKIKQLNKENQSKLIEAELNNKIDCLSSKIKELKEDNLKDIELIQSMKKIMKDLL